MTTAMTAEMVAERVAEMHAKRYPNGCGQTWGSGCNDCCERLGGTPPGPVFAFRRVGDIFGNVANADEIGAWLIDAASLHHPFTPREETASGQIAYANGAYYGSGGSIMEAYNRAVECRKARGLV